MLILNCCTSIFCSLPFLEPFLEPFLVPASVGVGSGHQGHSNHKHWSATTSIVIWWKRSPPYTCQEKLEVHLVDLRGTTGLIFREAVQAFMGERTGRGWQWWRSYSLSRIQDSRWPSRPLGGADSGERWVCGSRVVPRRHRLLQNKIQIFTKIFRYQDISLAWLASTLFNQILQQKYKPIFI